MASPPAQNESNAVIVDTSEFNEPPAVYLTRPTIGIGSEKPLFVSRRRTVGMNPSGIPVRSDAADRNRDTSENHNDEVGRGQRRFLRTGAARTLQGAFDAATGIMDGPQERILGEVNEEPQREYEAQAKHTSPSFKRPVPLARGGGTSVPGYPQRRPRNSSGSSTTAAARAPGLREAYQRVVDAEVASAVERGAMDHKSADVMNTLSRSPGEPRDSEDTETASLTSATRDEMRLHQLLNSSAAMKGSPQARADKAKNINTGFPGDNENLTTESGYTALSGISSIMADETDDSFGRLLSAYAKDKQRAQDAANSKQKLFTKTKVGELGGLSPEGLERKDVSDKIGNGDMTNTKISNPPIEIPKDWGRKGKHNTDWLDGIMGNGGKEEPREHSTGGAEMDRLVSAEDIPLPSIEDESTLLPKSQHQVEADLPTRSRKISADRAEESEEPTFPAQGITPHQNRSSPLDTIREKEIESLRDRAVTTSRLGEIKERTSRESLRSRTSQEDKLEHRRRDRRGSSRSERSFSQGETGREAECGPTRDIKDTIPGASIAPPYSGEGEHIPFTPITVFKKSQQFGKPNNNRHPIEGNDKKSEIDGQDSRDILRRLSRATSSSPKPTDDKEKASEYKVEDEKSENPSQSVSRKDPEDSSATPRPPKSLKFEELAKRESRSFPSPSFHINGPGAWIDTPAIKPANSDPGSPPSNYDVDSEISALGLRDFIRGPSSSPLYIRSGGIKGRPSKPDTVLRRRKSEPIVPTTRRQIEAAKARIEKQVQVNDTDLSSLFDFHPDDADNTYAAVPTGNTANIPELLRPLTNAERERQREMLVYECLCLNRRLRNLQNEIDEGKRGIEGLEGKISEDVDTTRDRKSNTARARANEYTVTIRIPGRDFARSFARSLVHDRKWRWLRWLFYFWCVFWVYAMIEFYFYTSTLPPFYASSDEKPKPPSAWKKPLCYPHPWTGILQLTRPFTWLWINVLRLKPPGPPIRDNFLGDTTPWKGSFARRVFEWNWNLARMDCMPHPRDRGPMYHIWSSFMKTLNYNV